MKVCVFWQVWTSRCVCVCVCVCCFQHSSRQVPGCTFRLCNNKTLWIWKREILTPHSPHRPLIAESRARVSLRWITHSLSPWPNYLCEYQAFWIETVNRLWLWLCCCLACRSYVEVCYRVKDYWANGWGWWHCVSCPIQFSVLAFNLWVVFIEYV